MSSLTQFYISSSALVIIGLYVVGRFLGSFSHPRAMSRFHTEQVSKSANELGIILATIGFVGYTIYFLIVHL